MARCRVAITGVEQLKMAVGCVSGQRRCMTHTLYALDVPSISPWATAHAPRR